MRMPDRQVRIIISGEAASLIRAAGQAENALGRVGNQGQRASSQVTTFGDRLSQVAQVTGIATGFAAVAASIKFVATEGMAFEDAMNGFKGVTNASATTMAAASAKAQELGSDLTLPATSAGDAAGAMLELAKGGMSAQQAMEATRGTLLLAAAASISGAEAATIQSNAINSFSLAADEAGHVADVLANTANAASGSVQDVGAAMSTVGGVANQMGISIEDTATALGIFAQNGRTGAEGGTLLRGVITSLQNQSPLAKKAMAELGLTVYDNQGKFVGLASITDQLAQAQGSMSQEAFNAATNQLFGNEAMSGAGYLAKAASDGYQQMGDKVRAADGAQRAATVATQGLSGAIDGFLSAAGGAAVTLFNDFSPALQGATGLATGAVTALSGLISWFAQLPAPIQATAVAIVAMVALNGPMTAMWASMRAGASSAALQVASLRVSMVEAGMSASVMRTGMLAASIGVRTLGTAIKSAFISNPIGIALVAATTALSFFASGSDDAAGSTANFTGAVDENTGALNDNAQATIAKAAADSGALANYQAIGGAVADYTGALAGNVSLQEKVRQTIADAAAASREQASGYDAAAVAADGMGQSIDGFNSSASLASTVGDSFEGSMVAITAAQEKGKLTAEGAAGATQQVGSAAAAASPLVDILAKNFKASSDAMDAAVDNAKTLADNTALAGMLGVASAKADDAKRALDGFNLATETASKRNETLDDATASYQKALTGLGDAFKDGTKAAKDNTDAGNLNLDALRSWNVSTLTATSDGQKMYDSLTAIAEQHTATTAAAYSDAVAHGDLAGANDKAREAATSSRGEFVKLATQYLGNEQQANDLADQLGILDGQKIDDKTFKTISDDAQARESYRQIEALKFAQKVFEITAIDNATFSIYNIQAALNAMPSYKQVTVETVNRFSTAAVENGGRFRFEDGGMLFAADGLITGRGQSQKRAGSGGGVTWAEKGTGTEYYLSMKDSMRDRNRGLASEAVAQLGGQAVWGPPAVSGASGPGAGSLVGGSSQPINLTLTLLGDGPITEAALGAAQVTVAGALRDVKLSVERSMGQS